MAFSMNAEPKTAQFDRLSGTLDERLQAALAKVALAARHELRLHAGSSRLSAIQAQILSTLLACESLAVTELARRLGLRPSTVSESLAALQRRGLVRRTRASDDQRKLLVRLTPRGRRLARSTALWPELFADAIETLTRSEKTVLFRVLVRMILSFLKQGTIQEARMCLTCTYFEPNVHKDPHRPHHCRLADVPLGLENLRLECPDHDQGRSADSAIERLSHWLGR